MNTNEQIETGAVPAPVHRGREAPSASRAFGVVVRTKERRQPPPGLSFVAAHAAHQSGLSACATAHDTPAFGSSRRSKSRRA